MLKETSVEAARNSINQETRRTKPLSTVDGGDNRDPPAIFNPLILKGPFPLHVSHLEGPSSASGWYCCTARECHSLYEGELLVLVPPLHYCTEATGAILKSCDWWQLPSIWQKKKSVIQHHNCQRKVTRRRMNDLIAGFQASVEVRFWLQCSVVVNDASEAQLNHHQIVGYILLIIGVERRGKRGN